MNTILQKRIEEAAENHEQCYNVGEEHGYLYTHKGDIKEAVIYGADFALQNQWISVDESMPQCPDDDAISEVSIKVIAKTNNGAIYYAFYHHYLNDWFSVETSTRIDGVTHWMYVPQMEGCEE